MFKGGREGEMVGEGSEERTGDRGKTYAPL